MNDEQRAAMGRAIVSAEMGDPAYAGLSEIEIAVRLGIVRPAQDGEERLRAEIVREIDAWTSAAYPPATPLTANEMLTARNAASRLFIKVRALLSGDTSTTTAALEARPREER